jgi:DNA-binding NarL/FixJ family response regulator
MKNINVLVVDDQNLFAKLIQSVLKTAENINVIGTATNYESALSIARANKIDVIFLDISMPNIDGIQALEYLTTYFPDTKIVMLSSYSDADTIHRSLRLGASGYITKAAETTELIDAVYNVYGGENYFCKFSLDSIMNNMMNGNGRKNVIESINSLSKREREVLRLIGSEFSSTKISKILNISVRTVQTHRKHLLQKLGVKNTVGLIKTAIEANLIKN